MLTPPNKGIESISARFISESRLFTHDMETNAIMLGASQEMTWYIKLTLLPSLAGHSDHDDETHFIKRHTVFSN